MNLYKCGDQVWQHCGSKLSTAPRGIDCNLAFSKHAILRGQTWALCLGKVGESQGLQPVYRSLWSNGYPGGGWES